VITGFSFILKNRRKMTMNRDIDINQIQRTNSTQKKKKKNIIKKMGKTKKKILTERGHQKKIKQ